MRKQSDSRYYGKSRDRFLRFNEREPSIVWRSASASYNRETAAAAAELQQTSKHTRALFCPLLHNPSIRKTQCGWWRVNENARLCQSLPTAKSCSRKSSRRPKNTTSTFADEFEETRVSHSLNIFRSISTTSTLNFIHYSNCSAGAVHRVNVDFEMILSYDCFSAFVVAPKIPVIELSSSPRRAHHDLTRMCFCARARTYTRFRSFSFANSNGDTIDDSSGLPLGEEFIEEVEDLKPLLQIRQEDEDEEGQQLQHQHLLQQCKSNGVTSNGHHNNNNNNNTSTSSSSSRKRSHSSSSSNNNNVQQQGVSTVNGGSSSNNGGRSFSRNHMEQEKRMRREIANSNERRRMQSINAGFQSLRTLLPHHEGEKLSKVVTQTK
uniref:BHLH domain-containing protein n=1 Tax=Trichogramma kaykai TaxID=54128 RepID=A0ABD2XGM8_9HYME